MMKLSMTITATVAKLRQKLYGETLREIGTLVLVFVPVDSLLERSRLHDLMFWTQIGAALVAGLLLISFGIKLETTE